MPRTKGIPIDQLNAFPILDILIREGLLSKTRLMAAYLQYEESIVHSTPTDGNGRMASVIPKRKYVWRKGSHKNRQLVGSYAGIIRQLDEPYRERVRAEKTRQGMKRAVRLAKTLLEKQRVQQ